MNIHEFLDEIEKRVDENQPRDWSNVKIVYWNDFTDQYEEVENVWFNNENNEIEVS